MGEIIAFFYQRWGVVMYDMLAKALNQNSEDAHMTLSIEIPEGLETAVSHTTIPVTPPVPIP
jgi:hypothetical protein